MSGAFAYLFWHRPADPGGRAGYERALADFHVALLAARLPGLSASWSWRVRLPPWLGAGPDDSPAYLDVYQAADFAALGGLAAAATSGSPRPAHDRVAAWSGPGAGGIVAQVAGWAGPPLGPAQLSMLDKSRGADRGQLEARLGASAQAVWMRYLTLGPGPEYLVVTEVGPGPAEASWSSPATIV